MSKNFFYCGRYFDTYDEFIQYVKDWPDQQVDMDWIEDFMRQRTDEMRLNLDMRKSLTNREAFLLLRLSTDWVEVR